MADRIQLQTEAAQILGVTPKALRDWMAQPGFPDCAAGFDIAAIRVWQQQRGKKGSTEDEQLRKLKLADRAAELRKKKAIADRLEREEEIAQGNILPRDEYRLTVIELIHVARDRLIAVPKELCRLVPKKYHRALQDEGAKEVRKILRELARGLKEENADDPIE